MVMLKDEFIEFIKTINFGYVDFDMRREDTPDIETVDVRMGAVEPGFPFTPMILVGESKLFIECKFILERW